MRRGCKALFLLGVLAAAAYLSARLLGYGCPFNWLTGISCPGCGLSRALAALLHLDFKGALRYNPMIYVLPPVLLLILFGQKPLLGSKKHERLLLYGVVVLWLTIYAVRLVLHDPLLPVDVSQGWIGKWITGSGT